MKHSGGSSQPTEDPPAAPKVYSGGPGHDVPRPATGPLTLADLASFSPVAGSAASEPQGWGIVGVDTNFYAPATPQVVPGQLLGGPAQVRFTPANWRWNYGDGTTATRSTAGRSWSSAGKRNFDPTPTSHIYRRTGQFTIAVTANYSAEYQIGAGPWIPVDGLVTQQLPPISLTIGTAKTVLVARDCNQNPRGPGC